MAADKASPFASRPAAEYANHQTQEKVTIAAVPYTSEEQQASAFGKARPYKYGILPVLVILQNDTGKTLRLNLSAKYTGGDSRGLDPISASDVVLFDGTHGNWKVPNPRPFPLPQKNKKGPLNTPEIEGRAFNVKLVPPGESVHGFFYFETQNWPNGRVDINGIKDAESGREFFYFEVPLEK
jgi:hypothetical protein